MVGQLSEIAGSSPANPPKKNHNHHFFVIFLVTFEEVTSEAGERRVDFLSDAPILLRRESLWAEKIRCQE
jgi:hypothetical protein